MANPGGGSAGDAGRLGSDDPQTTSEGPRRKSHSGSTTLSVFASWHAAATTRAVREVSRAFEDAGWQVVERLWRDTWTSDGYRGPNTTWEVHGQKIEVQFHTPQSLQVATDPVLRALYDKLESSTGRQERDALRRANSQAWAAVTRPGDWSVP